jgi:Tol biopolymer transport system component
MPTIRRCAVLVTASERSPLRVGALVITAIAAGLLAAASAGAASNGQIAVVDSDSSAGLSAIVLIPSDQLATNRNSKVLVSGPGTIGNLQWTPDGKTLIYDESARNRVDLYAVDVSNPRRRLLAANLPVANDGALSPDGKTVAYWSANALSAAVYLVGTDGQSRRKLAAGFDPSWSSDSSRLALLTAAGRIETIGADGAGTQLAGQIRDASGRVIYPGSVYAFEWAPDGESFLVATVDFNNFAIHIETLASNGTTLHVLSTNAANTATWSPNGTQVAFAETSDRNPTVGDRYTGIVANANGSDRHTIDAPASGASDPLELSWSPDGRSIVTADGDRVRVVRADATQAKVIAYPGDEHELDDPAWQPLS